jgi:hypothetical protein
LWCANEAACAAIEYQQLISHIQNALSMANHKNDAAYRFEK